MPGDTGATSKGWVPGSAAWGVGAACALHPAAPEPSQEPLPESGSRWRQAPSGGSGLLTGPPAPLPISCSYAAPTSCNPHSTLQNGMGKLRLGEWGDCPRALPRNLGPLQGLPVLGKGTKAKLAAPATPTSSSRLSRDYAAFTCCQ